MQRFLLLFSIVLLPLIPTQAQTNNGIWNSIQKAPGKTAKAATKTGNKLRAFKKHLEQWGLDTAYNHGLALGARLNSNGWTGLVYYQRRINRWQCHFFQLSLSEIKHEKQVKQQRQNKAYPELGNGTPYIFGKINNAYTLQLGHGREWLILPGVLEGNLSVSLRVQAGFSLAMLKPYYLKLIYVDYLPDEHAYSSTEKYSSDNTTKFLNPGYILGAAKWKEGSSEIAYIPGGYADIAVAVEPLKNKTFIKTITLGANFSIQSKNITIMADQRAYPWAASVYAGLSLGKRWR